MKKIVGLGLACMLMTGVFAGCSGGDKKVDDNPYDSTARGNLMPHANYGILPNTNDGLRDGTAGRGILPDQDGVLNDNGAGTGTMPRQNTIMGDAQAR